MIAAYVVPALIVAAITLALIWKSSDIPYRAMAIGVFVVFLFVHFFHQSDLLGRPKPIILENMKTEKAIVLTARIVEGKAVYLLLQLPGVNEPRFYVMPWDQEFAQQLQKAMRKAEEQGSSGDIEMQMPFERSWDKRKPKFYAPPQPTLPPKPNEEPPTVYRRPEMGA